MPNKPTYVLWLLLGLLLTACATAQQSGTPDTVPDRGKITSLQNDLAVLNGQTDVAEAEKVAHTAVTYSSRLAREYRVVRPAVLHNVLVRAGLRERGLCHHWTTDLMQQLELLQLKSYQLHWGVAHRGSELREHNSVVITASGQRFEDGIVLDPWRNSGKLYWARVKNDRYPWQERPRNEW